MISVGANAGIGLRTARRKERPASKGWNMDPARSGFEPSRLVEPAEATSSGVSWSAVFAGAFATAALGFTLMALGAGAGLSSISMWPRAGFSTPRVAPLAVVWIILVQALACALGGFLAGRLRTKWVSVHGHEVHFRDTAHGLLVWCVSLVLTVAFLSSLGASLARDLSSLSGDELAKPADYYADQLFRSDRPVAERPDDATRAEARYILAAALRQPAIGSPDRAYLSGLVANRTGLNPADAASRVDQVVSAERQAIEDARKAVAHSLYWLVVALLVGAFSASMAAVVGGRRRDLGWTN